MNARRLLILFVSGLASIAYSVVQAQSHSGESSSLTDNSHFVKDQYTIFFREPKSGEQPIIEKADRRKNLQKDTPTPFGKHSTEQTPDELERLLSLNGEVLSIMETMNAIRVRMSSEEAERLSRNPDVSFVEQVTISTTATTQTNPYWALDRLDESSPGTPDGTYNYTHTGAGQTVYVLDSGLTIGDPMVTAEFGTRASVIHDYNGGAGTDCRGHGTNVASLVGGNTYGIAKGATIIMAKVTDDTSGCSGNEYPGAIPDALNWLAANAPAGTIVNVSFGHPTSCGWNANSTTKTLAIQAAAAAGIMVFVAAGNAGCSVDTIDWKSIPEAFTVGALADPVSTWPQFSQSEDRRWSASNFGAKISAYAPGQNVAYLSSTCSPPTCGGNGTSLAAPLVAGIAAVACQANYPDCSTNTVLDLYATFRALGSSTVLEPNGSPLPAGHPGIVIWQQW